MRDQLKFFFDNIKKRTFIIFPPMVKKTKKHKHPIKKDDGEEYKNDDNYIDEDIEVAQKMNNEERYYLYKYFEANKDELDQILLEDAGVDPCQARINLDKAQLMITIKTTKKNYSKVAEKVIEMLQNDVKHQVIVVDQ